MPPLSRLWQLLPVAAAAGLCMYLAALPALARNGVSPLTLAGMLALWLLLGGGTLSYLALRLFA